MALALKTCPHCHGEIDIRRLPHQGLWKSYRICPSCGGAFTVDRDTKTRQAIFLAVALLSLVFTLLLYFDGTTWLFAAIASYIVLGVLIYRGDKKVVFVPYRRQVKRRDEHA